MPTHPSHHDPDDGPIGTTRTRLPEGGSAATRRPARSSRTLVTVVGVVVLLVAALAFATRGTGNSSSGSTAPSGSGSGGSGQGPQAAATAPTGTRPVTGDTDGIPTGFPRTAQGAQSAAANYAVALGGDGMFHPTTRHTIVSTVYTPAAASRVMPDQDRAYSQKLLKTLGLDAEGNPPAGMTFISRTIPVGTKVQQFSPSGATVAVWYTGLIGMAGTSSTDPVHTDWMTWTFHLAWTGSDWRISTDSQQSGPAPVPGDDTAAGADVISKAVSQFGGFTYAR
jgi:hypothetical protein